MEQGFGDVINFFRFLPYLQKMGHSITTIVPKDDMIPLKCFRKRKNKIFRKLL